MSQAGKPKEGSSQSRETASSQKKQLNTKSPSELGKPQDKSAKTKAEQKVSYQAYKFALYPELLGLDDKKFEEVSKIKAFRKSHVHNSDHHSGVTEFEMSVRVRGPSGRARLLAQTTKWIEAWKKHLKDKNGARQHEADFFARLMTLGEHERYANLGNIVMTVLVSVVLELLTQSRGELRPLETIETADEFLDRCSVEKYRNDDAPYKALSNLFRRYADMLINPCKFIHLQNEKESYMTHGHSA